MHDLVLRSSLLYVYCMIYEILEWGYDGMNMEILGEGYRVGAQCNG